MMARNVAIVSVAWVLAGCSSDRGPDSTGQPYEAETIDIPCPITPHQSGRPKVMVVDHGFDLRHPAFKDKLAACYSLTCPDGGAEFVADPGETEDEAAARYRDWLATPGPDCEVTTKLTLSIDAYIEHFNPESRDEWNRVMLEKGRLSESSTLDAGTLLYEVQGLRQGDPFTLFPTIDAPFTYHGTSTAGAIAYQNDVELVIVDRPLGSETTIQEDTTCLDPAELDLETKLLARPEVRDAYVHAPLSGAEKALVDLRRKEGVQIENHSYGTPSAKALEKALAANDCPKLELGPFFELLADLESERDAFLRSSGALDDADPLLFQSAGNEGLETNTAADNLDCVPERTNHTLVGSYDIYRQQAALSEFSNFGDCVDLYAPGESLVLPGPNGFYAPVSGTSFSAPLAARYASMRLAKSGDASTLLDAVLAERDENRFLPPSLMPAELEFYDSSPINPRARANPAASSRSSALVFRRPR